MKVRSRLLALSTAHPQPLSYLLIHQGSNRKYLSVFLSPFLPLFLAVCFFLSSSLFVSFSLSLLLLLHLNISFSDSLTTISAISVINLSSVFKAGTLLHFDMPLLSANSLYSISISSCTHVENKMEFLGVTDLIHKENEEKRHHL